MEYQQILNEIYNTVKEEENLGNVASYIPELAKVNSEMFGVHLLTVEGDEYSVGNWNEKFSIQSISKVLSLSLAYKLLGDKIWERVGVEPSGTAFNSLVQLESDRGIPRNPFLNSGALVICDMLISELGNAKAEFLQFVRDLSSNDSINYNEVVIESEKSVGYRNVALCNFIKSFGNIVNKPNDVLDFYFSICSIEMTCKEMTDTFYFLTNNLFETLDREHVLNNSKTKRINAIMQSCGFYDESGEFTFKVGVPGKSGVGGGILAVHPNKYCICVWSPKLNKKGNSYRGMRFLELFTTKTESSIF
ncbi:UNVERIFIED_CONTAM: hypothetical protein GTU68_060509 [Idotea baltica]|nr:hypothetical protein [Idotea baltica]